MDLPFLSIPIIAFVLKYQDVKLLAITKGL